MGNSFTNKNTDQAILNDLSRFHGFYNNVYRDPFIGGNAFIFVTKPLLFIDYMAPKKTDTKSRLAYMNMTKDPFFAQYLADQNINSLDREIIKMLSYNINYENSVFLPMFTNQCKGFDSNDSSLEQMEVFDTKQGYREVLPTHKTMSEASNTVSITVSEDSNLDFTKLLSIWVNYISNITDGTFDANPDMILNGVLDYMCSIYYFVLAPDGKTIKYWCRYTGCWPTTIPYSNLKYSKGQQETIDLDIPFVYTVKEDMNPKILEEFNMLSLRLTGKEIPYSEVSSGLYNSFSTSPLLNREEILAAFPDTKEIFNSKVRDPLILIANGNTEGIAADKTSDHYELVFDDFGYEDQLIKEVFTDNSTSFINDIANNTARDEFANLNNWQSSGFWNIETIE